MESVCFGLLMVLSGCLAQDMLSLVGKPVSQSSLAWAGVPERAIDGNTDGMYFGSNSCTHTDDFEPYPWWMVDLGATYRVESVRVYNRDARDCCAERLNLLTVAVSDSMISDENANTELGSFPTCGALNGNAPRQIDITCAEGITGRYVYLYLPQETNNGLTLCEVNIQATLVVEPECQELSDVGNSYSGDISTTFSGKTCQRWESDSPQSHDFNYVDGENYCRNPDKTKGGTWCFTTDSNERWEYCGIPFCGVESSILTEAGTGNSGGEPCAIPFTYKGVTYQECTQANGHDRAWCSLTSDYAANGRWGYCIPETCPTSCYEENVNKHISYGVAKGMLSVCECAAECYTDEACVGFDYNSDSPPYLDSACWLHYTSGDLIEPFATVSHYARTCK